MGDHFRILDLGAHDGFVTQFCAKQAFESSGIKLYLDGLEANSAGVDTFNRRAEELGIPGHCKRGLVEDASSLWKPHSYDAVVAYELIEHVTDVDEFLTGIEQMVKVPTGRVYISTPNGTYGEGNNPHHLRTWNMTALFDILRRRGLICDALPGPDGVSVVSYTPRTWVPERKSVVIFTGSGWEKWAPSDIETKGLGGSETAAVRLAEALDAMGCLVTVYGEVTPGAAGQVLYKHHTAWDPTEECDLFIGSRIPEAFGRPIGARSKVLWMHDVDCGPRLTEELAEQIDRVMVLSQWHEGHVLDTYPFLAGFTYITRNGIEPSYFEIEDKPVRAPHRAVYTSSPDRGLDFLLRIWPRVRKHVPDAELWYAYANVYNAVAQKMPQIAAFRDHVRELADQPGVTNMGSLTQPSVARSMLSAGVWLAPSWSTPTKSKFHETFCIGAVEAAAAGCHRVMSAWGALEERDEQDASEWVADKDGQLDEDEWVCAIVRAMTSADAALEGDPKGLYAQCPEALAMDWQEVAADFLASCAPALSPSR